MGSSSLASRTGFMCVVGAIVLGFRTLYRFLWLVVVCVLGGSKDRLCGINSGRFEVIFECRRVGGLER